MRRVFQRLSASRRRVRACGPRQAGSGKSCFLVNPETEILSTTHVSPQQMEALKKAPAMHALPAKLLDTVPDHVRREGMTREEAEGGAHARALEVRHSA